MSTRISRDETHFLTDIPIWIARWLEPCRARLLGHPIRFLPGARMRGRRIHGVIRHDIGVLGFLSAMCYAAH